MSAVYSRGWLTACDDPLGAQHEDHTEHIGKDQVYGERHRIFPDLGHLRAQGR